MKTKKFLSMAALALVGAMMTGCSNDDDILQPENKTNVVTLTTTVGFDEAAGTTRGLSSTGVKTFGAGDQMAVIYHNGTSFVKAVSHALEAGDITNEGKNATFTFDLETPSKSGSVLYIYPAAMAGETGVDMTKLNTQEGTFDALQSKYDLCTNFGDWDGDNLPSLTLNNLLAILAVNLKNGSTDITGDITDMSISDGTNNYYVSRSAAAGPIYVAILPTSGATINVTASDDANEYGKTLTTKTYAAGNGYNVTWNMSEMTTITWNSSNIGGSWPDCLYVSGTGDSYSKEGITLSTNADQIYAEWQDYGDESMDGIRFNTNENSGGFTFTAPTGKYFTNIEMTLIGQAGWDGGNLGTGWTFVLPWDPSDPLIVTWKGTPTNTVDLLKDASHFHGETVKSIVFTVY